MTGLAWLWLFAADAAMYLNGDGEWAALRSESRLALANYRTLRSQK